MPTGVPEHIKKILDNGDCAGPVSEALIEIAEFSLRVRLPPEYRAFVRQYGAALFDGFEIYGLVEASKADEPPVWTDLRGPVKHGLPTDLIPISDDGGDYRFYLRAGGPASPVVVYGPGLDGIEVASSFFEFLAYAAARGVSSLMSRA